MITKFIIDRSYIYNYQSLLRSNNKSLDYQNINPREIDDYIFEAVNGEISAKMLADKLFPEIKPHIFISHSSKDKEIATQLANTLYNRYGVYSFIDSQIWGHIDHATKKMHDLHCLSFDGSKTYSYERSNNLLSHLHSILSNALMNVMDNSDSVLFIESENSVYKKTKENNSETYIDMLSSISTASPWISSEINFANKLRFKPHVDRGVIIEKAILESANSRGTKYVTNDAMPKIIHEADIGDFIRVSDDGFFNSLFVPKKEPIKNLDGIYHCFSQ